MKTKLIIFDFDGTLTKPNILPNSWARIWDKIGRKKDDDILYNKFLNKEIDYNQWANEVISIYREEKVSKKLLNEIAENTKLLENTNEVIKYLHNEGIKIIVLSGGIKNIIEDVLHECLEFIYKIEAQELIFDNLNIVKDITILDHQIEDKSQYVNLILNNLNIKAQDAIFFGNGKNDEDVYKTNVKTICINPDDAHYDNKIFWKEVVMKTNDLKSILPFIL